MHILITSDIFPPGVGGPATYVLTIARALAERGHPVRVLTYSLVEQETADAAYPFTVERILLRGPRWLRLIRAFIRVAVNVRWADVLYINGLLIETALVNALWRRPAAAKVVGDIAWERAQDKGWIADEFEEFQKRRYGWRIELRRALRNWSLNQMSAVVAPSAYLGRIIEGWGVHPDRIRVIYNAYEPAATETPPANLPLTSRYRVITVCRLVRWKGVNELIEVIAALHEVGLIIVGDGPERANLESLVQKLGITDRVYFAGEVPRQQVITYLRACDLFVLNSRYEGLPHVVLEAMAAGLPVVATAVGGTPEVVEDEVSGLLISPGDTNGLRDALVRLLSNESLHRRLVENARVRLANFSLARMIEQTASLLEELGQR
ncbi:MAG: glycosyltransferase family 4 protein [Anaerolineae bacterium]